MKSLDFIEFAGLLKRVERFKDQTYFRDFGIERYESVADHTWRMTLILCLLKDKISTPFDLGKVVTMIAIHDLPEVLTGDLSPLGESGTGKDSHAFNTAKAKDKNQLEESAAEKIFAKLGDSEGGELLEVWQEIEKQETFEARLVKAIDALEGRIQAWQYLKDAPYQTTEHHEFNKTYKVDLFKIDPALEEIWNDLLFELENTFKNKIHTKTIEGV